MRLTCRLREYRGDRSLRNMADATNQAGYQVSAGELSRIERGTLLPTDKQIPALEQAYGHPATDWYDPIALLAIQVDEAT